LAGTEKELARKYVQFYRAHPLAALQKPAVLPSLVAVPARTPLAARVVDSGLEGRGARGAETTGGRGSATPFGGAVQGQLLDEGVKHGAV